MKNCPSVMSAFNSPASRDERPGRPGPRVQVTLSRGEQRIEPVEVLALVPLGDLVRDALVRAGADVAELGDVRLPRGTFQLGRKIVDVEIVGRPSGCGFAGIEHPLMIEGRQKRATILQRAQPVEANRVEPLEDVPILAVLGSVAVLLHEPLDLLEAGDDPLLPRRAP